MTALECGQPRRRGPRYTLARVKSFDRKFGPDLLASLPASPAVYLFKDAHQNVLYVGKAKDVRRRLASYRNASRRKVDRKKRRIVREAESLEVRVQPSEREALVVENQLIRTLEPPFNVEGKYTFLYPAIGIVRTDRHTLLCFTTDVDAWSELGLRWFGTFRSRLRAKEAFDALVDLLALLGHLEPRSALGDVPYVRGSRLVGVRQLSAGLTEGIERFLSGASRSGLIELATALLEKPRARREAAVVQEHIDVLDEFFRSDLETLREALHGSGRHGSFVSQDERDTLFIRARE